MSGTQGTIRLNTLRPAVRDVTPPLLLGLTGLFFWHCSALADQSVWDCRVSPDGRGWQCDQLAPDPTAQKQEQPGASSALPADPENPEPGRPAPPTPEKAPPSPQPAEPPAKPSDTDAASPAPVEQDGLSLPAAVEAPIGAQTAAPAPPAAEVKQPIQPAAPTAEPATEPAVATSETAQTEGTHAPDRAAGQVRADTKPDRPEPGEVAAAADTPAVTDSQVTAAPHVVATAPAVQGPNASRIDDGIDWGTCRPALRSPGLSVSRDALSSTPVDIDAEGAVAELDQERVLFNGAVELVQGDVRMYADELVVNRATGVVDAKGDILMLHPDIRVAGGAASYQLESGQGRIEQASYRIPSAQARGDAGQAELLGEGRSSYQEITYTTCRPGDSDWLLTAEALELDQAEGLGTARHAKMRFLGVPLLYAPVFTFPIDDRRRSGLLVPSFGQSKTTGTDIRVPYYFNLAENYDLTLTPRLMSKRGVMLGGEFRFLTENTGGTLAAEYLPDDREYDNEARSSASVNAYAQLGARSNAKLRLNYVSDDDYLNDFGTSLAATSATHLERAGEVRYFGDTWDFLGRVQHYQTIDPAIPADGRPYSRLPQLLFTLENPDGIAGTTYQLGAEYVNFDRTDALHGSRVDLFPSISLPIRNSWSFVEPRAGARYTAYRLTDTTAGIGDSPSRFMGMFSVDSGMYFDRSASYFGNATTQTLEPRMYYLYVPYRDQDDQPLFDTAYFDFGYDNLFRDNRFNGPDRFGDANQVTLALTNRTISDENGEELLRASIAQTIYFEDRKVTLIPGAPPETDSTSPVLGELVARLGAGWRTRAGVEWNTHQGSGGTIDRSLVEFGYHDSERHVFNAAYRMRRDVTEQTDLAAFWPLGEKTTLIGRYNYSLRENRVIEALAGVEYGRCCWRVRALVRRYADGTGDDHNVAFLLQLELNGLGRFGDDIDQVLERGIYGYREVQL